MRGKGTNVTTVISIILVVFVVMVIIFTVYKIITDGEDVANRGINDTGGAINPNALCIEECKNYRTDPTYVKNYRDKCKTYYDEHVEECN